MLSTTDAETCEEFVAVKVWLDVCEGCVNCGVDDGLAFWLLMSVLSRSRDEVVLCRTCKGTGGGGIVDNCGIVFMAEPSVVIIPPRWA